MIIYILPPFYQKLKRIHWPLVESTRLIFLEAFLDAASGGHVDVLRSLVSWRLKKLPPRCLY